MRSGSSRNAPHTLLLFHAPSSILFIYLVVYRTYILVHIRTFLIVFPLVFLLHAGCYLSFFDMLVWSILFPVSVMIGTMQCHVDSRKGAEEKVCST